MTDAEQAAEYLRLIRWAYELTERALFLQGHKQKQAMVHACAKINQEFKALK